MVAKSVHCKDSKIICCNVVNVSDLPLFIKSNSVMGVGTEVEQANEEFDKKVSEFVPLDLIKTDW